MKKQTVLVLDDRRNWLDIASEVLQDEFDVELAQTYEEAIEKITKKDPPYHVLISDIRLNDGDPKNTQGLEVAEFIKNQGSYTNVIFWTAYESIQTAIKATKLNAIDYFVKNPEGENGIRIPFDDIRDEFKKKVKEAANLSKQKRWEKTVLVVEDNEKWSRRLSELLYRYGYRSDILNSYKEAEIKIKDRNYRALITELAIDGNIANGFEFIKNVNCLKPETKIIIVSDSGNKNTIRDAFVKYNVTDFFLKEESDGFYEENFITQIQNIYMPENEIFVLADFKKLNDIKFQISLIAKKYVLTRDNAVSIWLPPYKNEIEMEVVIYTDSNPESIQIAPSSTQKWIIPRDGKADDLNFIISPIQPGSFTIYPELFGNEGWWRRMNQIFFDIR